MSIVAYTGLPRHGKSYTVVEYVILPAIKAGREVWTNIPLRDADLWRKLHGAAPVEFDTRDVLEDARWFNDVLPKGVVLVLDECWRVWPSGLKAVNANPDHLEFLTMHGHKVGEGGFTTEVVLVTQNLSQIAACVRDLVEFTYRSVKLLKLGMDKRFRVDCFEGCVTGPNPPVSKRLSQQFYEYREEIFDLYISHTASDGGVAGKEAQVDKRSNMLALKRFRWWALLGIASLAFIVYAFMSLSQKYHAEPVQPQAVPVQPVPSVPVVPPPPRYQDLLRDHDIYIIWNNRFRSGTHYQFVAETKKGEVWLSQGDFMQMHYLVRPVNQCMAIIQINGRDRVVTCRQPQLRSDNPFSVDAWTPDNQG